ncbi:glycosyltransferase family 2 protein [Phenylobacterium aquaticum]|uniref:glycosyltransferase family 2 protein n=1 Tax=Phenylobacterium aquaticum TaxID=1763816 RepID=UPI0026EB18C0|nr:glycosyltransferase family 2 protein [Phenylobacterium aquaticum]
MTQATGEDKTEAPQVSVVIVAYRSGPTLAACVERLAAQSFRDFELVLVDNASPDGEAQGVAAAHPFARLIENPDNRGFAAAMNQGAQAARGRWLALLNPDAFPEPDWLEALIAAAARHPKVRSFTARQLMDDDPSVLDGLGDVMSGPCIPYRGGYMRPDPGDTPEGYVFSPCGAAMLIDRALFLGLGGFDETFFCYCEDVDLGYRLQLAGEPTVVVPKAVIRHVGSASSGGPKSEFAVFHGTRNRFWVLVKDTPWPLLPLVLPLHLLAVLVISTRVEGRKQVPVVLKAYRAAFKDIGLALAGRKRAQAQRRVSAWAIARAMTWNLQDLRGRRPVIRPIAPSRPAAP